MYDARIPGTWRKVIIHRDNLILNNKVVVGRCHGTRVHLDSGSQSSWRETHNSIVGVLKVDLKYFG